MEIEQTIPVAAPIDTDSAGKGGNEALQSVFRILSLQQGTSGTGFLHKSGVVITAEHVVRNTPLPLVMMSNGGTVASYVIASDPDADIAILKPNAPLPGTPLTISSGNSFSIGTHVSTWGFPGGYTGVLPMLSVGYLSGVVAHQKSAKIVQQWVVNAAFNSGNSGGPLLHIETGHVIGVISSKLAPISPTARHFLDVLEKQAYGMQYNGVDGNGKPIAMSEAQIVATLLNELRQQVQLVIGMAVTLDDLRSLLTANQIQP